MAAAQPRVTMTVTGKSFDTYFIGVIEPDGTVTPYPHRAAYTPDEAFAAFGSFLKSMTQHGESPVDAVDLLHHQKTSGVQMALVLARRLQINDKYFTEFEQIKKNPDSDALYTKLEQVLPKVKAEDTPAEEVAMAHAARASEGPTMTSIPVAGKTAAAEEPRRDPSQRKPMRITTISQGNAARDNLAETLKSLEDTLGVRAGHDGGGLKAPMIMSARKTGAVLLGLDQMTDDEITERDSMALAGGGSVQAEPAQERITLPKTASVQDNMELDPFEGLDMADLGQDEGGEEIPATSPAGQQVQPTAAPAPRPAAPPMTTLTGDEAEHLGAATSQLSEDGRKAARIHALEGQAVNAVGEDVVELFATGTRGGVENTIGAAEMDNATQEVGRGGRVIKKTGVTGTGRGGVRPGSPRDKVKR